MPRLNRAIELLEQSQPIYYTGVEDRSFEGGVEAAKTWADYLTFEMEHGIFDIRELSEFMRGLAAGGPTRSGHRTPAIVVTLPMTGIDEHVVRANSWQITQVLATGIHGILLCHAESPAAVKTFVEHCRYPFNRQRVGEGLDEGRRGNGGQSNAAAIWGISSRQYFDVADPWPLNPKGELFLGLKIENKRALANVEKSLAVPGIAFAEWGPGDMGMSLGYPDNHDEPYPDDMIAARARVLAACKANNIAFLNTVRPDDVVERIKEGVRVGAGSHGPETAEIGRRHTGRTMPW
jgi:4-hydroxy-2-oxoheptanedioate aldolase